MHANIAGFAAAGDYPDAFRKDALLSNPDNFRFYATIHIPLIRAIAKISGSYATAFSSLIIPTVFLHLSGFYTLGRTVLKSRYWSVLLAASTLVPVNLKILGLFWGIYPDVLPRIAFQAFLPFLLSLAYF